MRILSPRESAWKASAIQVRGVAHAPQFCLISLLLVVSTVMFASSISDITGPGQTDILAQLMVPTSIELPYSTALPLEFDDPAPPPDLAMLPGSVGPFLSTPLLNDGSAPMFEDTPEPNQAYRLTTFIGVVLLAGGLMLYLRSAAFHDWFNQFLFDAFSPLKYD
jgi:hypothetical protein